LTPALRDQPPLSGPMNGIARQFPARPEPILGLSDIAHPPDIHLVGLRRSLVSDYAEAVRWYRRAAEQGDANAQLELGTAYDTGKGVAQDYAEAAEWYRKAAEQGWDPAQWHLGSAYSCGRGVQKDDVKAYMWISLAAAGFIGDNDQRKMYSSACDALAAKMTPQQIAEAEGLAREMSEGKNGIR
jgi:TPR repeat protein